ncbi:hypothetical protein NQ317_009939 [Molorchus minor]|uniref:Retinol dehydrogenase 11 n=1 Tax=Molorchus minor TaxID=1323400 RepID=A0ABQ9K6X9_9CUCU|nr:hypothetical protein NQ317_009939 [Molorchus minor]
MGIFSARCTSLARLDGKTAVVTGSNTGIGKVTAQDFFQRGARVIMACRNLEKANEAVKDIKENCSTQENVGELIATELDLSSLKSVRNCAKHLLDTEKRIDLLINNAGVMMCPKTITEDGYEMQFATNHLGHFLLTLLLLPKISQSTPARIVNVSSIAHERGKIDFTDINCEKGKYKHNIQGVNVYSLHPGVIRTELGRHLNATLMWGAKLLWNVAGWFLFKTIHQGAQTTIYCAVDEKCANETGLYYSECAAKEPSKDAQNMEDAKKLWNVSLDLVGLPQDYNPFS